MKAIETKYSGPTNTRGAKYIATAEGGHRVAISADYALDAFENHERAAKALMSKLGWDGRIVGGGTTKGYAFVFCAPRAKRKSRRAKRLRSTLLAKRRR
jgi:hypothetical protein